jgi:hypothetical protein
VAAFYAARLDEDEAVAKAAAGVRAKFGVWDVEPYYDGTDENADLRARYAGNLTGPAPGSIEVPAAEHAARHDPARVLREAEADRTLLRELQAARKEVQGNDIGMAEPLTLRSRGYYAGLLRAAMIRATRFADHPDYRAEWKP